MAGVGVIGQFQDREIFAIGKSGLLEQGFSFNNSFLIIAGHQVAAGFTEIGTDAGVDDSFRNQGIGGHAGTVPDGLIEIVTVNGQ